MTFASGVEFLGKDSALTTRSTSRPMSNQLLPAISGPTVSPLGSRLAATNGRPKT